MTHSIIDFFLFFFDPFSLVSLVWLWLIARLYCSSLLPQGSRLSSSLCVLWAGRKRTEQKKILQFPSWKGSGCHQTPSSYHGRKEGRKKKWKKKKNIENGIAAAGNRSTHIESKGRWSCLQKKLHSLTHEERVLCIEMGILLPVLLFPSMGRSIKRVHSTYKSHAVLLLLVACLQ